MNKRQKKKLFKKRSAFYPNGGPDVFLFQVFTGVGMTKKKWARYWKICSGTWNMTGTPET